VSSSYFRYNDLKKIIALSSILHMNIGFISIISLNSSGIYCNIILSIAHACSSVGLFLMVGVIINRTYSRLIDSLYFISNYIRLILLLFIISNNGFPGSINYISEMLSLVSVISVDYILGLYLLVLSFISTLY